MKKVGKEFKKTLSAILVAAMVFTSLPETTLVAKAAEEDQQQTVYDVDDVGGDVNPGESKKVESVNLPVTDSKTGQAVDELTASAEVLYNETTKLVYIKSIELVGDAAANYSITTVGGVTTSVVAGDEAYRFISETAPTSIAVVVEEKQVAETATIQLPESVDGQYTVTGESGEVNADADYKFTVTPADEQTVTVTATKADDTEVTVTDNGDGTYTIAKDQIAKGDVITVAVKATQKTYAITLVSEDSNVTSVEYKKEDGTFAAVPADLKLAKGATLTLKVAVKAATATERYEAKVETGTDTKASVEAEEDGTYKITITGATTVTVTAEKTDLKDVEFDLSNVSKGYVISAAKEVKTGTVPENFTTVTKLASVAVGEVWYLKITPAANKTIKAVTYNEAVSPITTADGKVYKVIILDKPESTEDYKIVVEEEDATVVTLSADANTKLYYAESDVKYAENKNAFIKVPSNGQVTVKTGESIYVYAEYAAHFEKDAVKKGTEDVTAETTGNYKVTADEAKTITFTAKAIENTFTVKKVDNLVITVSKENVFVYDETAKKYVAATTDIVIDGTKDAAANNKDVTIMVNDGKKVSFKVEPSTDNKDFKKVTATVNGKQIKNWVGQTYPFQFESAQADSAKDIVVTETKLATPTLTYTKDANVEKIEVTKGDAAAAELKADTDTATEGDAYSFKVTAKKFYKVSKVTVQEAGATAATEVKAEADGSYKVTIGTKAIAINIETAEDYSQYNSVTFNFKDATVTVGGKEVKSGEAVPTRAAELAYTVTAASGYTIKAVTAVEIKESKDSVTGTVTFTKADPETPEAKTVEITTAAKAATADQYIKVAKDANYTFAIEGVTPTEVKDGDTTYNVYKISKDTLEAKFTATTAYGYKLTIAGNGVKDIKETTDKKTVTYTGIIVTNLVNGTDKAPAAITVTKDVKTATVSFDGEPDWVRYYGTERSVDFQYPIQVGEKITIKVPDGKKLYTVDGDKKTEVKLDAYNKYSFTVEKDINFKIEAPAAKEVKYDVYAAIGDGAEEKGSAIATDYTAGKVALTITEANQNAKVEISKAKITTEGAKSKVAVAKVEGVSTATVTIDKADAGKTLSVDLYTVETDADGVTKEVVAATATIKLAAVPTVTVKGIKAGQTVKLDAGSRTEYDITVAPIVKVDDEVLGTTINRYIDVISSTKTTQAFITDEGKLAVLAPSAEETADISIVYAKDNKNVVFSFKVQSVLPTLKLSKVDSPAQAMNEIVLTLAKDKNVKAPAEDNLFYEVIVTAKDATAPAGSLDGKAFYFNVCNGEDSITRKLKVNSAKITEAAGKYEFASRIVLVKKGSVTESTEVNGVCATAVTPVAEANIVKAGPVVKKTFSTKNAYYEDKLSLTKKTTTLYNNGDEKTVAVVKYSKNASYINDVYYEVFNTDGTRADWALDENGEVIEYASGFGGYVDNQTGEVKVGVYGNVDPGKYDVVVYAEGVKNGDVDTMYRATAKVTINVQQAITNIRVDNVKLLANSKKDVTYTFKPVANTEAKTKKFAYELEPTSLNDNAKKNVTIDAKGKLTIKKGFVVGNDPADNKFKVNIYSADFGTQRVRATVTVEVTNQKIEIGEVYLASYNEDTDKYDKLPTTITLKQAGNSYYIVKDTNGNEIPYSYYSWKASNSNWYVKPGSVQFTATALDGGKSSKKSAKYTITYENSDKLEMVFDDVDGKNGASDYNRLVATGDNSYEYYGTVNPTFDFTMKDGSNIAYNYQYGYTIAVKGGKLLDFRKPSFKNGNVSGIDAYGTIVPTDKVTTITITKANKQKITVTLTNKNFQTTKAPSAKLVSGKLYAGLGYTQDLTYKVTGDYDAAYITYESGTDSVNSNYTVNIDKNGEFKLESYTFLKSGTGKYSIVYGKYDDNGNFIPKTKAATLSIKVNKLATYKPQTSYTLNLKDSKYIELTGKPVEMKDSVGYFDLRNANIKGQPNKFLEYFAQVKDAGGNLTNQLVATDKLVKDVAAGTVDKNNLIGYVKYIYSVYKSGNVDYVEKDVKITIKIDTKDKKYVASGLTILNKAGAYGYSDVTLNKATVELGKVAAVDSANWKAEIADVNTIKLTAVKAPVAGKQKVQVKILTTDSQYTDAAKDGVIVEIPVTVGDAASFGGKVIFENAKVDLSKAGTDYDTTAKSGVWVASLFEGDDYEYAIEGIELKTVAVTDVTGVSAKYVGAKIIDGDTIPAHIDLTVSKNAVKLGKTITVPVDLTFADGSVAEQIKLQVVVPKKVADMASVKAEIQKYLTSIDKSVATSDITDNINAIVNKNVIAGVTASPAYDTNYVVEAATSEKPAVTSTKVTVTLTDRADSKITDKLEVVLAQSVVKEQTLDEAYTALADKAALLVTAKGTTDADKDKVIVTNATTRFTVRQLLTPAIKNDKYMLSIINWDKKEATKDATGYISFSYRIVTKDGAERTVDVRAITIEKLPAETK